MRKWKIAKMQHREGEKLRRCDSLRFAEIVEPRFASFFLCLPVGHPRTIEKISIIFFWINSTICPGWCFSIWVSTTHSCGHIRVAKRLPVGSFRPFSRGSILQLEARSAACVPNYCRYLGTMRQWTRTRNVLLSSLLKATGSWASELNDCFDKTLRLVLT